MSRPRRVPVWFFRIIVTVHAVMLCAQPVSAGAFLSGQFSMLTLHTAVGGILLLVAMAQVVAAVFLWRPAGLSPLPILLSLAMVVAEIVQISIGVSRVLWLHLPLGVFLIVVILWLVAWSYRLPVEREPDPSDEQPRRVPTA